MLGPLWYNGLIMANAPLAREFNFTAETSFCSFPVKAADEEEARQKACTAIKALGYAQLAPPSLKIYGTTYTGLAAIEYLYDRAHSGSEWQEAGMWYAVCKVVAHPGKAFTELELSHLLDDAENN